MIISLITAMDRNRLIGNKNQLPWHLPADFAHFKSVTMGKPVIIVTGSSGFLGSAICVDLNRDFQIVGMDCRAPSIALQKQASEVWWQDIDISDSAGVNAVFDRIAARYPRIEFVLHMAAFYHFGQHWLPEDERVNIRGLRNILEGASRVGTKRFVFAGSIASLAPAPVGARRPDVPITCRRHPSVPRHSSRID